jgi:hypothetical protein
MEGCYKLLWFSGCSELLYSTPTPNFNKLSQASERSLKQQEIVMLGYSLLSALSYYFTVRFNCFAYSNSEWGEKYQE